MAKHRAETNSIMDSLKARRAVQADATERGKRTFVQGLAVDVLFAIATTLLLWLPDADLSSREAWLVIGTALLKTALTAAASYVMRLKVAPQD